MEDLMDNHSHVKAFWRSQVDKLTIASNASNIWKTAWAAHCREYQVRTRECGVHLPTEDGKRQFFDPFYLSSHLNLMQGTSRMIFPRACVMFSICGSMNIGSTMPAHSKVSILYGTYPRCQREVGSLRKAFWAEPLPMWLSGTAMSPSTRAGVVSGGTNIPRKEFPDTPWARKWPNRPITHMVAAPLLTRRHTVAKLVYCLYTGQDLDLPRLESPSNWPFVSTCL